MDKTAKQRFSQPLANHGQVFKNSLNQAWSVQNPASRLDEEICRDLPMMRQLMQVALGGKADISHPQVRQFSEACDDWHAHCSNEKKKNDPVSQPVEDRAQIVEILVEKLDAPAFLKEKLRNIAAAKPSPEQNWELDNFFAQMQAGKAVVPDHSVRSQIDGLEKLVYAWGGHASKTIEDDFGVMFDKAKMEFLDTMPGEKLRKTVQFNNGVRDRLLADLPLFQPVHEKIMEAAMASRQTYEARKETMIVAINKELDTLREKEKNDRRQQFATEQPFAMLLNAASAIFGNKKVDPAEKIAEAQQQRVSRHLTTVVKFYNGKITYSSTVKAAYDFFNSPSYTKENLGSRLKNPHDPLARQVTTATDKLLDQMMSGKSASKIIQDLGLLKNNVETNINMESRSSGHEATLIPLGMHILAKVDERLNLAKKATLVDKTHSVKPAVATSKKNAPEELPVPLKVQPLPPSASPARSDVALKDIDVVDSSPATKGSRYSEQFDRSVDRHMKKADPATLHDFLRVAWGGKPVSEEAEALSDLLTMERVDINDTRIEEDSLLFPMGTRFISPAANLRKKIVDALDLPPYLKTRYESINRADQMSADTRQKTMQFFLDRLGRAKPLFDRYPDMGTSEALGKLAYIKHFKIQVDDAFADAIDPIDRPDSSAPDYDNKMQAYNDSLMIRTGLTDWLVSRLSIEFQKKYENLATQFFMPLARVDQELIKLLQAELPDVKRT